MVTITEQDRTAQFEGLDLRVEAYEDDAGVLHLKFETSTNTAECIVSDNMALHKWETRIS